MKRFTLFLFTLLFLLSGCFLKNEKGIINRETKNVRVILYFPTQDYQYLLAEERVAVLKNPSERTIVEEIIKGSKKGMIPVPPKTRLLSIDKKDGIITLNFSKEFIKNQQLNYDKIRINIYSIVNSLTEIPSIKGVLFKVNGKPIEKYIDGVDLKSPLKRDRNYFLREKGLDPSEVLRRQMEFEAKGMWLDAYLLMSDDESNTNKKYYNEYVIEMEEVKTLGFLNIDYKVGKYTIESDGKSALVNVDFFTKDSKGKRVLQNSARFKLVKIDGMWMVDWLTSQSRI